MRILIYSLYFYPELTGISKIIGENARWLAERGHEITVVTAHPHYPAWKRHDGYPAFAYRCERWGKCQIWRCPVWVPRVPGGLTRLVYLASFAFSSLPPMLWLTRWRPDAIMLVAPTLLCGPATLAMAKYRHALSWLNIKDYELDAAFALGILSWRPLRRLAEGVETAILRRFNRVSSISPAMVDRARSKGSAPERTVLFRDWVDLEMIREDPNATQELRTIWSIAPEKFVVLYSGNLGMKQGLEILVDAARRLASYQEILFVICGEGAAKKSGAGGTPVAQCHPEGIGSRRRLNALLHLADLHVLPQRVEASDLVMPSKLLYMLASQRPIVATADPATEVGLTVRAAGGTLTQPGDGGQLAEAILDWWREPSRRQAAGRAGRGLAETQFDKNRVLQGFLDDLVAACTQPQPSARAVG